MGNLFFSDVGESKDESIINLSESCVNRITGDHVEARPKLQTQMVVTEDAWMKKLKRLDDCHSTRSYMAPPDMEKLFKTVEHSIGTIGQEHCSPTLVLECLQKNEECLLNCKNLMDDFINCIDKVRLEKIKQKANEEAANPQQEIGTKSRDCIINK